VIGFPIAVGAQPMGVAVTPDGGKVYVANSFSNTLSVIDTATDMVIGSPIAVGFGPTAFGIFIKPASRLGPRFAGTPGSPNCHGESVSALAQKYGGLAAAADALRFASVSALQDAIRAFCNG
jgi:YVTN family beta-propeller protein